MKINESYMQANLSYVCVYHHHLCYAVQSDLSQMCDWQLALFAEVACSFTLDGGRKVERGHHCKLRSFLLLTL